VAVGILELAEDILVPPLLRNCLTLNYISFSWSLSPLQNGGPCSSFHCLGHFKNVRDDDDDGCVISGGLLTGLKLVGGGQDTWVI